MRQKKSSRRPGGEAGPAAALALEEMTVAMGFVVGKRAGAPPGSRVRFELTGASARRIDVEVGAVLEEVARDLDDDAVARREDVRADRHHEVDGVAAAWILMCLRIGERLRDAYGAR